MRLGEETARRCRHIVAGAQVRGRSPSVTAAVLREGGQVWSTAVGAAQVGGAPATPDTQYRVGSITKTVTALLVLQLRDEGRLDLTDRLGDHLPDAPLGDARLVDLLSHSAGAAREPAGAWWERNPGVDYAELVRQLAEDRALPPRRAFHYSNLAFGLLGQLVTVLRGGPWFDVVRDRVLEPLGMAQTTYLPRPPHATGYDVHPFADAVHPEPAHDAVVMAPAGQLWSTVGDLLLLGDCLANPRDAVLGAGSVDEMCAAHAVGDNTGWPVGYGLGVFLYRHDARTFTGHAGSMPGFLAGLVVDRASGVGSAVLANCYQGPDPIDLAERLVECVLEHEPPLPAPWQPATDLPRPAAELVGHWYWGSTPYVVTWRASDPAALYVARGSAPDLASRFEAEGPERWRGRTGAHAGEVLDVRRGADGTPVEVVLSTYRMRRTPYGDPPD